MKQAHFQSAKYHELYVRHSRIDAKKIPVLLQGLEPLREHIRRKRLKFWQAGNWSLHHDNEPSQHSFFTQPFFDKDMNDYCSPLPPSRHIRHIWLQMTLVSSQKGNYS